MIHAAILMVSVILIFGLGRRNVAEGFKQAMVLRELFDLEIADPKPLMKRSRVEL